MWPIEAIHFVAHAARAAFLFQSGRQDRLVRLLDAVRYQLAGTEPKHIVWYDAVHSLRAQSLHDQDQWPQQQTGIHAQALARLANLSNRAAVSHQASDAQPDQAADGHAERVFRVRQLLAAEPQTAHL